MTFFAGRGCVQSDEREARQVMVEHDLLRPMRFIVAAFAFRTELPFVCIIGFVTRDACG